MKFLKNIIPSYSVLPLLLVLLFNMGAYYISKPIVYGRDTFDLSIPLDNVIPLVSPFIVIYLLAFLQWVIGYVVAARESREMCARIVSADIIAKTICFLFFIIMPTSIDRPEVTGNGIFDYITKFIYFMDTPINLFPSIHCLESYAVVRFAFSYKKVGRAYKISMCIFSLLVFASVLFTRQHFFIDIPAGILAFEIGIILSKITRLDKLLLGYTSKR